MSTPEMIPLERALAVFGFYVRIAYEDGFADGVQWVPDNYRTVGDAQAREWLQSRQEHIRTALKNDDPET